MANVSKSENLVAFVAMKPDPRLLPPGKELISNLEEFLNY